MGDPELSQEAREAQCKEVLKGAESGQVSSNYQHKGASGSEPHVKQLRKEV